MSSKVGLVKPELNDNLRVENAISTESLGPLN